MPAGPDNEALRQSRDHTKQLVDITNETNKSSRNLEKLTKVLILFTIVVIGTSLPNGVTTMINLANTNPHAFVGIFVVIAILFMVGIFVIYPQDVLTIKNNVLGHREVASETSTLHVAGRIEVSAHVKVHKPHPFELEDYRAAISLLVISIIFLEFSYRLRNIFPSSISNIINPFIASMWIVLFSSIIIILIIVYRTFKQ